MLYSGEVYTHLRSCDIRPKNIITIMGPSKTESLSGFRLGVAFGSPKLIDRMESLQAIVSLRAAGYNQAVLDTWLQEPLGWMENRIQEHELTLLVLVKQLYIIIFYLLVMKNLIKINNINDIEFNFLCKLTKKNSIEIKKSKNININIDKKINKISIINSSNIIISIIKVINSIEVENSDDIVLNLKKNCIIPLLHLYKSTITINIYENDIDNINIINEESKILLNVIN